MTTLGEQEGTVYVTLAAAEQFARFTGLRIEEARRTMTELLLDATERPDGRWRRRNRTYSVELTVQVSREGRLLVVTHAHVRSHQPR